MMRIDFLQVNVYVIRIEYVRISELALTTGNLAIRIE